MTSADGGDKLEAVCLQKRVLKSLRVTGCAVFLLAVGPLSIFAQTQPVSSAHIVIKFRILGERLCSTVEFSESVHHSHHLEISLSVHIAVFLSNGTFSTQQRCNSDIKTPSLLH